MDIFKIALTGNPNSGKTTLFNKLTGSNHYVGNWPGVTVEKMEGRVPHKEHIIDVVDLPGIYSLSPYTLEEKIARTFILEQQPDVVLNIVDATTLERSLYLTLQLIELGRPVVVALNMMDEAEQRGMKIDVDVLSAELGVPVVPIIALRKKGIAQLMDMVVETHHNKDIYRPRQFAYSTAIEDKVSEVEQKLMLQGQYATNLRWLALKTLEGDPEIVALIPAEMRTMAGEVHQDLLADERYRLTGEIVRRAIAVNAVRDGYFLTDRIDRLAIHPYLGIPVFGAIMWTMFYLTFTVGGVLAEWVEAFFGGPLTSWAVAFLESLQVSDWLVSLIVDGVIGGVGGVLTFVPNIAIVFILISFLEDVGYMARAAYLMDHWMSKVGLNGKSFIPMVLGFGCNVPGIMSTRTIENEKDRLITILINPFMSCAARFPIYVLFASVFFPGRETLVTFSLYSLGIVMAFIFAFVFRKTIVPGQLSPLIMELPPYRFPLPVDLGIHVWEKVRGYLVKAGTVIFGASVILWFVLNFNGAGMAEISDSFGATIGRGLAPIFAPLGFGTWQNALSLLSGLVAKEIVVANTGILYGLSEAATLSEFAPVLIREFSRVGAYAFLVFVLLYTPCVGVIGVIRRETNSWRWTIFSVLYQFAVAWTAAVIVFQVGSRIFV